jgi:N utilization substance protein A
VVSVRLDRDANTAFLAVPDKQLSLAIGKEGQNARLAAQLTGRRIDIRAESALMQAGEDMYPPPEPNMEAIPLERPTASAAAGLQAPETVAPSQATYARPGLPGEHARPAAAAPAPVEEEVRLTPEQEVLAAIVEEEEEQDAVAVADVEQPARAERPSAAPGGLRFAEEIGEVQRLTDDEEAERGRRDKRTKRRGGAAPAGPVRARPQARPTGRRFDLDEVDEDEIEAALHGDDYLDDEDEYADDEQE